MSKRARSTFPSRTAKCNGVDPSLSLAVASAPCLTSKPATTTYPLLDARCNGVCLSRGARECTSSGCAMAKKFTTEGKPQKVAYCKGLLRGGGGLWTRRNSFQSIFGWHGSHIQTQIARCGLLGSNSCFIASSTFPDTPSKWACSTQYSAAYSARGNVFRLSLVMF